MTTPRQIKSDIIHAARTELAHATMCLEHANTAAAPIDVAGDAVSFKAMSKMTVAERYWHLASLNAAGWHQQVLVVSKETGRDYAKIEATFRTFVRTYEGK